MCLDDHQHIARHDEIVDRCAGHDTQDAERDSDGDSKRDRDAQTPDAYCATRYFACLECDGNQCRFCNRRAKTDGECKQVDPVIVLPAQGCSRNVDTASNKFRMG